MAVVSAVFLLVLCSASCFAQKRCCFADQYTVHTSEVIVFQNPSENTTTMIISKEIASDFPNNRISQVVRIEQNGQIQDLRAVLFYNNGTEYAVYEDLKTCIKVQVPGNVEKCLPDEAIYTGSMYVGAGDRKVYVEAWHYYENTENLHGQATMFVTRDEDVCITTGGSWVGIKNRASHTEVGEFFNYTNGIGDPDRFFSLPDYCDKPFDTFPPPTLAPCKSASLNSM